MSRRSESTPFWLQAIPSLAGAMMLGWLFIPGFRELIIWALGIGAVLLVGFVLVRVFGRSSETPVQILDTVERPASQPVVASPRIESLPNLLRRIDWFQFEKLVAAVYRAEGFSVRRLGGAKPDGGVDLIIERDGAKTVVQCKQWRTQPVREKELREFLGTLTDTGISNGLFVTLRGYTKPAEDFAHRNDIALVGERGLISLLEKVDWKQNSQIQSLFYDKRKYCPRCEQPMVQRTAQKGWRAGHHFWGCSTYPKCSYIFEAA